MSNRTEGNCQPACPEETIDGDVIRVERPDARAARIQTVHSTATYSWRDLAAADVHLDRLRLVDADRDNLPYGSADLQDDFRTYPTIGGLLIWNLTRDEETGTLVMVTGQTAAQEQQVMENAGWMVSCGAVYAARRVGMRGWKTSYDDRVIVDGDELLLWTIANDADSSS